MARPPMCAVGTELRAPALGFPCFIGEKRLKRVITADIGAYLGHTSRSTLAGEDAMRAVAFVEQAGDFYNAAAESRLASRPLLYYYAYLNLAKAYLLHQGAQLPEKIRHGLTDPSINIKQRLQFKTQTVHVEKRTGKGVKGYEGLLFRPSSTTSTPTARSILAESFGCKRSWASYQPSIEHTQRFSAEQSSSFPSTSSVCCERDTKCGHKHGYGRMPRPMRRSRRLKGSAVSRGPSGAFVCEARRATTACGRLRLPSGPMGQEPWTRVLASSQRPSDKPACGQWHQARGTGST